MRALFVLLAVPFITTSCSLEETTPIRFALAPAVTVETCNENADTSAVDVSLVLENYGVSGAVEIVSLTLMDSDLVSGTETFAVPAEIPIGESRVVSCVDGFHVHEIAQELGDVTLEIRYRQGGEERVFVSSVAIEKHTTWDNCGNISGRPSSCTVR